MKTVLSIKIDTPMARELDKLRRLHSVNISDYVRRAIEAALKKGKIKAND